MSAPIRLLGLHADQVEPCAQLTLIVGKSAEVRSVRLDEAELIRLARAALSALELLARRRDAA